MKRIRRYKGEILIDGKWIYFSYDIWQLAEFMHDNYLEISKEVGWKVQENTGGAFDKLPYENQRVMLELAWRVIKREHGVTD